MRVAVISDIHANLAALQAVLADAGRCDEVWCLGDIVGYGPHPNGCTALVRSSCALVLAGNHDLAACGRLDAAVFSHDARRAMRWTREIISPATESFLNELEPSAVVGRVGLYHASPRDPVWEYVLDPRAVREALEATDHDLVMVGHTHDALCARVEDGHLTRQATGGGADVELAGLRALVNPGSVGQPRDGDPRAAYVVLELDGEAPASVRFVRVEYDIAGTQRDIQAAGLPEHLADRLSFGM